MQKILIADDNIKISAILTEYAKKEGFEVITAIEGKQAIAMFEAESPNIILLDVMMPEMDGFEVCRKIRATSNVPIIMITARGEDFEKIMGLDIGADDYIVKPFSPAEVMARVRAILRRLSPSEESGEIFEFDNLNINLTNYAVKVGKQEISLTKKEIELFWTLATNKMKVFSRDNLLNTIWGYEYYGDTRTVDSHIKRLRAKLDKVAHPNWDIKTIWGVGYRFEVQNDKER